MLGEGFLVVNLIADEETRDRNTDSSDDLVSGSSRKEALPHTLKT